MIHVPEIFALLLRIQYFLSLQRFFEGLRSAAHFAVDILIDLGIDFAYSLAREILFDVVDDTGNYDRSISTPAFS